MNNRMMQPGGSVGILSNSQALARLYGITEAQVGYSETGEDITGCTIIYHRANEQAFAASGVSGTVTSGTIKDNALVLVTDKGTFTLSRALLPLSLGGTGANSAEGVRHNLGLGSAAVKNTGTSGDAVPLLNTGNTWSAKQIFSKGLDGELNGNASSASVLRYGRNIYTDLGSNTNIFRQFNGSMDFMVGVTGVTAIENGGTGANSAESARKNLGLGSAAVKNTGTSGDAVPLLNAGNTWAEKQTFSKGVSGELDGNAKTATTLQTARTFITDLTSEKAASFNGAENVTMGVSGLLPLTKGGTGANSAESARKNLGLGSAAVKNTGTSGDAVPLLNAANTWAETQTYSQTITAASQTAFRTTWGEYGSFLRSDGDTLYLLLTNKGDSKGNWNSLRPMSVNYTSGRVSFSNGISGALDGNAKTATTLQTARTFITNLASGSAANFNGADNVSMGVTGLLPLTNGGTGANNAEGARKNLGLGSAAVKNTGTSGDAVPLLNAANTWAEKQTFSKGLAGELTGNASTATRLLTGRSFFTNLGAEREAWFDGQLNVEMGVFGLLPISKGGTGAESAEGARWTLGLGSAAVKNTGTSDGAIPLADDFNAFGQDGVFSGISLCNKYIIMEGNTSPVWFDDNGYFKFTLPRQMSGDGYTFIATDGGSGCYCLASYPLNNGVVGIWAKDGKNTLIGFKWMIMGVI